MLSEQNPVQVHFTECKQKALLAIIFEKNEKITNKRKYFFLIPLFTFFSDTSKKQTRQALPNSDDIILSPSNRHRHPLERTRGSVGSSVCSVSPPCSEILQIIEASRRLSSPAPDAFEQQQQQHAHTPAPPHLTLHDPGM